MVEMFSHLMLATLRIYMRDEMVRSIRSNRSLMDEYCEFFNRHNMNDPYIIHGIGGDSDFEYSDSGKSELDEEYFNMRPPPLVISQNDIIIIQPRGNQIRIDNHKKEVKCAIPQSKFEVTKELHDVRECRVAKSQILSSSESDDDNGDKDDDTEGTESSEIMKVINESNSCNTDVTTKKNNTVDKKNTETENTKKSKNSKRRQRRRRKKIHQSYSVGAANNFTTSLAGTFSNHSQIFEGIRKSNFRDLSTDIHSEEFNTEGNAKYTQSSELGSEIMRLSSASNSCVTVATNKDDDWIRRNHKMNQPYSFSDLQDANMQYAVFGRYENEISVRAANYFSTSLTETFSNHYQIPNEILISNFSDSSMDVQLEEFNAELFYSTSHECISRYNDVNLSENIFYTDYRSAEQFVSDSEVEEIDDIPYLQIIPSESSSIFKSIGQYIYSKRYMLCAGLLLYWVLFKKTTSHTPNYDYLSVSHPHRIAFNYYESSFHFNDFHI